MHPQLLEIRQALADRYSAPEATAIARWLLTDVFGFTSTELYGGKDRVFSANEQTHLQDIIRRLRDFEPLQYILGRTEFDGHPFEVTPDVLIPRPETAELVEWICRDARSCVRSHTGTRPGGEKILDIGTGSGCIPISLKHRLPQAELFGWDISPRALEIARRNAALNGVDVTFEEHDILTYELSDSPAGWDRTQDLASLQAPAFDVVVSNPPYICEKERATMERNVLDWEPSLALFVPDSDPLLFYRRIAQLGPKLLRPGGALYFEINQAYGKETVATLEDLGYHDIALKKDMEGNDRMIKAII